MGILDKELGFIRFDRWIVFVITFVLAFYGVYFCRLGYNIAWLFFLWAAIALVANFLVKSKTVLAFGTLTVSSFILFYTLRYYIVEIKETPHFEVFSALLTVTVGISIDALYWVYKYDKGKKFKTSFDD